ncbi:type I-E CRISPR-associated protein Cse2/CasB [Scandinavium lactucae]|uniref:Type I-E CRISPR-associated protein Cse2/CasB n=1 Tax=Scandinavium lactucae TaxID=3095028 RepID=A0ABU4QS60_9ENTR|nr:MULTISPECIES: type I-E CRISPR-associated protein Cse2/CasB [unclassified Scandinavium]MDX6041737.1 type I-E CRISPR-associated protein Cse2/CasB [Scandinavium sp. V105_6]MDX6051350.1 type I-E CRISPR-associated protein Cse2/CasB [Scandinavium sp. V105_1]
MDIVKNEHGTVLCKWHHDLQDRRGLRASLRRSTTITEACLADGFRLLLLQTHTLWNIERQEWRFTALALVAAVAAHIKSIDERKTFAAQLGQKMNSRQAMSELRFRRLCEVKKPDDLLRQLRRAVQLLNGTVNLSSLADDIFRWCREADDLHQHHRRQQPHTEFIRIRWAMDYYQAEHQDEKNPSVSAEQE